MCEKEDALRERENEIGQIMQEQAKVKYESLVKQYNAAVGAAAALAPLPGYEPLAKVLQAALDQSQRGKGKERHATAGVPFLQQPICTIGRMVGVGYNVGQAMKKSQEARRLPTERAQAELLGAIVYLASAYILLGEGGQEVKP